MPWPRRSTAERKARHAARELRALPGFKVAARVGLAANGLMYVLIGVLAASIAVSGRRGTSADEGGAFEAIAQLPIGRAALWVVAVATLLLTLWQLSAAAVFDDEEPRKRWLRRAGYAAKAVGFASVAGVAVSVALRGSDGGGPDTEERVTSWLLGSPIGGALLVLVGGAVAAVGVVSFVKGVRRTFFETDVAPPPGWPRTVTTVVGIAGFTTRGVAFGLVGSLFVAAVVTRDPEDAGGLDDALLALAQVPFGQVLLWAIAVGLTAFGCYGGCWALWLKR